MRARDIIEWHQSHNDFDRRSGENSFMIPSEGTLNLPWRYQETNRFWFGALIVWTVIDVTDAFAYKLLMTERFPIM